MNIILSLLVLMMPLDVPPTAIWLGKGVDPVKGKKLKPGDQVDKVVMSMSPYDFVRLKNAMEGSTDLCSWAITEAVAQCTTGLDQARSIAIHREERTQDIISSYEHRLAKTENELLDSQEHTKILMYVSGGLAILAATTTTLFIWGR
tara:strand:- start:402 stop:842 length:441 start_codon:yes stop_codon:yes gene_type:complete